MKDASGTRRVSELASGLTRNQVPRKGLWVRIPCPPLRSTPPPQVLITQQLAAAILIDPVNWANRGSISSLTGGILLR